MNIVFKKILGDPQAKTVKRLRKRVNDVNKLADKYQKLTGQAAPGADGRAEAAA